MADKYEIRNMVRAQSSRIQRKMAPMRPRAVIFVLGQRVLPQVPIFISSQDFREHYDELIERVKSGEISIVRPDRVIIDSLPNGTLVYMPPNGPITFDEPGEAMITVAEEDVPTGHIKLPADPNAVTKELPVVEDDSKIRLCIGCRTNVVGERAEVGIEYCPECVSKLTPAGSQPVDVVSPEAEVTPVPQVEPEVSPDLQTEPQADTSEAPSEAQPEDLSDKSKKRGKKQR